MVHLNTTKDPTPKDDLVRHMVLNSLRSYRRKFSEEYGELVICCDDKSNWRKQYFPYYKQNRKEFRKKSPHDWNEIFEALERMKSELREFFPYPVLQVEHAEADDIIGAICHELGPIEHDDYSPHEDPILIISGDKDLTQLQVYDIVSNYSPTLKKFIKLQDPQKSLYEHILRGDQSDGVPNFLSADASFVDKVRQKPIRANKIKQWLELQPEDYCDEVMLRGYKRNELLIDLSKIPEDIKKEALNQFANAPRGDRSKLLSYFINNNLNKLLQAKQEF